MQLFKSNSMETTNSNSHRGHVSSNRSMSDTDSQFDTFHSPLRSESPLRSDDPDPTPEKSPPPPVNNSKALVAVDKYFSPLRSDPSPSPLVVYGHRQQASAPPPAGLSKVGGGDVEDGGRRVVVPRRMRREGMVRRAELGFRVLEAVVCLISFSVMAADKTEGWSGDSFDRYKEYRYCVAVTVIGFVYSAFQACDVTYSLATGKHVFYHRLRYHFDFAMDQILAYLLISASSSAATRVDNWVSNWGKDDFTEMASASIGMSFLAFAAFALSSLISGYNLCNHNPS